MGSAVAYNSTAQIRFHQKIATQEDAKKHLDCNLICREYMKDALAGQFASVNAIDGRGEEEDGTNRTDEHSSLRATSHQPTSNGGDKNTKALMAQQRGETHFKREPEFKSVERSLRRSTIDNNILENKGCQHSIKGCYQRGLQSQ